MGSYKGVRDDIKSIQKTKEIVKIFVAKDYLLVISSLSLINAFYIFTRKNQSKNGYFAEILSSYENSEFYIVVSDSFSLRQKAWEFAIKTTLTLRMLFSIFVQKTVAVKL